MIKEFTTHIANNTSFTIGTTLFDIGEDSDPVDTCVVIAETAPGLANGILTDLRQVPLTAYSKGTTHYTARDNAYTLFTLLHGKQQIALPVVSGGSTYTCNIECGTPYFIGLDEAGRRYTYVMPIDVTVTNIT